MVSLMCNSMQDVEAAINNALCASASLRLRVEFGNKNAKAQRRKEKKPLCWRSCCVGVDRSCVLGQIDYYIKPKSFAHRTMIGGLLPYPVLCRCYAMIPEDKCYPVRWARSPGGPDEKLWYGGTVFEKK